MPKQCWAKSLGDCQGKLSKEHTFSATVLDELQIEVTSPATNQLPRTFGIASLSAKILCKEHNSRSSPLDSAAGKFREVMDECTRLASVRREMPPRKSWTTHLFEVDGPLIERWFLKTLINVEQTFPNPSSCWERGSVERQPSEHLVRMVYGQLNFSDGTGLHAVVHEGLYQSYRRVFQCTTKVIDPGGVIVAGAFSFYGLNLALVLDPELPGQSLAVEGTSPEHLANGTAMLHPHKLWFYVHGAKSHAIRFNWGQIPTNRTPWRIDIL